MYCDKEERSVLVPKQMRFLSFHGNLMLKGNQFAYIYRNEMGIGIVRWEWERIYSQLFIMVFPKSIIIFGNLYLYNGIFAHF